MARFSMEPGFKVWRRGGVLLMAAIACGRCSATFADEKPVVDAAPTGAATYQMAGTVTLDVTGEPVPGAKVRVLVAGCNPDGTHRSREAVTDARGRYAIQVPAGHARTWTPTFPSGYWADSGGDIEDFVTAADKPIFTKNYVARRGPVWRVRVASGGAKTFSAAGFSVAASQRKDQRYLSTNSELDAEGTGAITIPGSRGEFQVAAYNRGRLFEFGPLPPATLKIDSGFRSDEVERQEVDQGTQTHRLTDKQGRTATLRGARASIENGVATIEWDFKPRDPKTVGALTGLIVDDVGEPVPGATVGIAFRQKNGPGMMTSLRGVSDMSGRFLVEYVPLAAGKADDELLNAVVTKVGYAAYESRALPLPRDAGTPRDLGRLCLDKGHSVRIRVVGPRDEPLAGAWVQPSGDFAAMTQEVVTDAAGFCEVRDLKQGTQPFLASYGNLMAEVSVDVDGSSDEAVLHLRPIPQRRPIQSERPLPLRTGAQAPEFAVSGWSDDRARKLADFRGKVVVLDFWGIWCGPCLKGVPVMKELETKFSERDVVFLSIHSAGTPMKQVRQRLQQLKWDTPAGLDDGEDVVDGATVQGYGVTGFPTVIVIDRAGNVHFNSASLDEETGMKKLEQAAAALSLPWPLKEDATKEESYSHSLRLFSEIYRAAIEEALAVRSK